VAAWATWPYQVGAFLRGERKGYAMKLVEKLVFTDGYWAVP